MKLTFSVFMTMVFMLISETVTSQSFIAKDSNNVDVFWYEHVNGLREKIDIESIVVSDKSDFFRLWLNGVVVEVWYDKNQLNGRLTHWAEEYVSCGEEATDRYFVVKDDLDSHTCADILSVVNKYEIRKMPSSQYIDGWKNGFDGVEYIIEDKMDGNYKFKNYWTPSAQEGLYEAGVLVSFIEELMLVINEKERSKYFHISIPFHSWVNGGGTVISRVTTYGEAVRMKQERNRYRKLKKL